MRLPHPVMSEVQPWSLTLSDGSLRQMTGMDLLGENTLAIYVMRRDAKKNAVNKVQRSPNRRSECSAYRVKL